MEALLIGVAASIVGGVALIVGSYVVSVNARRLFTRVYGKVSGTGLTALYDSQTDAGEELSRLFDEASRVWIFAARGNELASGALEPLLQRSHEMESIRILLPDPDARSSGSWLTHHAGETSNYDTGYDIDVLAKQIESNLAYLRGRVESLRNVTIRSVDFPTVARVVISDSQAMLTMYSSKSYGRNAPCIVVSKPSPIYDYCERIFLMAWEASYLAERQEN